MSKNCVSRTLLRSFAAAPPPQAAAPAETPIERPHGGLSVELLIS